MIHVDPRVFVKPHGLSERLGQIRPAVAGTQAEDLDTSEDSPLEYFRGKAVLERALIESGLSHAILRPAVLFGEEDILVNNIAWSLRRMPVFGEPTVGR